MDAVRGVDLNSATQGGVKWNCADIMLIEHGKQIIKPTTPPPQLTVPSETKKPPTRRSPALNEKKETNTTMIWHVGAKICSHI